MSRVGISRNWQDSDEGSSDIEDLSSDDESHLHPLGREQCLGSLNESNITLNVTGSDDLLHDISGYIFHDWKGIGRHLLKRECLIEGIDIDFEKDSEREKAYQLLLTWKRQMGSRATLENLKNTLIHTGRRDTAVVLTSLCKKALQEGQQHSSTSSDRTKSEIEGHTKLQKLALRELKRSSKFYQKKVKEIEDFKGRVLENEKARQLQEKLKQLNDMKIQSELDVLQMQLHNMQEKSKQYSELDKELRVVAQKLFEVEQTVVQFEETLDDLRLAYYSECKFGGILCHIGLKFSKGGITSEKKKSVKIEEECNNNAFESPCQKEFVMPTLKPNLPRAHPFSWFSTKSTSYLSQENFCQQNLERKTISQRIRHQECHVRRKLNVSGFNMNKQFQVQEIPGITCSKYHQRKPVICRNTCIKKNCLYCAVPDKYVDFKTLPVPCYKSSEDITLLVTRSPSKCGMASHSSFKHGTYDHLSVQQGYFNVISDLV